MKNILKLFTVLLFAVSCSSQQEPAFKGKNYQLLQPQNDVNVTLGFDKEQSKFYGKIVNNFFGSYKLDGQKINFGPVGSTMMMGAPEEMEAETNFLQILPKIESYSFNGNNLILKTNNGQELGFREIGELPEN